MKAHSFAQGSPEWYQIRIGKVTGSTLKRVVASKWIEYSDEIAGEILTGYREESDYENEDMIRGKELEPLAIDLYESMTMHKTQRIGFIEHDYIQNFGISPDRYIPYGGIVEVKCPRPKGHIKTIRTNKVPAEYWWQCIAAFVIDDSIQFVDFVSYCPEIEDRKIYTIQLGRIDPDVLEAIEEAKAALIKFNKKVSETIATIKF